MFFWLLWSAPILFQLVWSIPECGLSLVWSLLKSLLRLCTPAVGFQQSWKSGPSNGPEVVLFFRLVWPLPESLKSARVGGKSWPQGGSSGGGGWAVQWVLGKLVLGSGDNPAARRVTYPLLQLLWLATGQWTYPAFVGKAHWGAGDGVGEGGPQDGS